VPKHGILPAVVKMQVSVDDQVDVTWRHVVLVERIGHRAVDDAVVSQHLLGTADARID
jgi:hypothetical protein